MIAFLAVVAAGVLIGLARGGSLRKLAAARIGAATLVFGAVALQAGAQFVPRRQSALAFALVVASYAAVFAWAVVNRRAPGMTLIAVGALLNFIVIAANQGMPVSAEAAARAGYVGPPEALVERGKHILASGGTRLRFLGDVIPVAGDRSVVSAGDLAIYAGLILLVQHLLLGPRGARALGHRVKRRERGTHRSPEPLERNEPAPR